MCACRRVVNPQPVLVGYTTGEQRFHGNGWRAEADSAIGGFRIDDVVAIGSAGVNTRDVGSAVAVETDAGVTITTCAAERGQAGVTPGAATIGGSKETLQTGAIVVIASAEQILRIRRIRGDRIFIHRLTALGPLHIW